MRGCNHLAMGKKKCPFCGKNINGGKGHGLSYDTPLAYTGAKATYEVNPFLAYTGQKGGSGFAGGPAGMSSYQPSSLYPSGTVGSAWTGQVSDWPGVGGVSGNHNFLSQNKYINDPQTVGIVDERSALNAALKGGLRRKNKSRKNKRGGSFNSFIPTDLMNIPRSLINTAQSTSSTFLGRPQPPSYLPQNGQLVNAPSYKSLAMFR